MHKDRQHYNLRKQRAHKIGWVWLSCLVVVIVAVSGFIVLHNEKPRKIVNSNTPTGYGEETSVRSIAGKYMFSGTTVLDRTVATDAKIPGGYDWSQPFGGMSGFGTYDAGFIDLECPVTSQSFPPSAQIEVDNPKFNCLPGWLPTLKKYYQVINLSSNHAYDWGGSGFTETESNLKAAGLQVVGNFDPHANKDNCTPVFLPVHLKKTDGSETTGNLPVAVCSFNYKDLFSPNPGEIAYIHKYQAVMPVFALLNSGIEYQTQASTQTVQIAHEMIDNGAEFVIGDGSHTIENSEAYKGKLIAYSLGNFIFDQADPETRRAANILVTLSSTYDDTTAKWLAFADQCRADTGQCLSKAMSLGLQKPKLSLGFQVIASEGGYKTVTHVADPTLQTAVEQRLDWATTLKGLR